MGYIKFDKSKVVNLEYSLGREILRTNRAGSYSSTTIVGCNTRKYHGLLVCPVDELGGDRYVLLSSLDVTVLNNDSSFNIGIRKYNGDYYSPKGHKYVEDFDTEIIPSMTYRVGGVKMKQERILVHYEEQFMIRYTILEASETMNLQIKPFLAFRNIHELTRANLDAYTKVEYVNNGIKIRLYDNFPWLHLQLSSKAEFIPVPDWHYGVEYPEEQRRGYDFTEDLYVPGFFEVQVKAGDAVILSASTKEEKPSGFRSKFSKTVSGKIPRDNFVDCLKNAAQQFVERRSGTVHIIAGYHWYGARSRDTFISLPGLVLARQNLSLYTDVLDTLVKELKNGLFPLKAVDSNPDYGSADTPLWFFWTLQHYLNAGGTDIWKRYGDPMRSILRAFRAGTDYNIGMRENGLIYADAPGKALTWMDAMDNGTPVTPRNGYAVEINALWYNAVCFALDLAKKSRDRNFIKEFEQLPDLIKRSFNELFWNEKLGYLADYVNDDEGPNTYVRPNMIMAVSLPYSMLLCDQMKSVLDIINRELVTPRGLRTLSPGNRFYSGTCEGNENERDCSYHQGTAWPWLTGPFCEGWLKIYGKQGSGKIRKLIYGFEETMSEHGISTISEIYDGNPPHTPRGTISQAWSVGEILRIIDILDRIYPELNNL
jgi:predicted glycogen debranching enzyme